MSHRSRIHRGFHTKAFIINFYFQSHFLNNEIQKCIRYVYVSRVFRQLLRCSPRLPPAQLVSSWPSQGKAAYTAAPDCHQLSWSHLDHHRARPPTLQPQTANSSVGLILTITGQGRLHCSPRLPPAPLVSSWPPHGKAAYTAVLVLQIRVTYLLTIHLYEQRPTIKVYLGYWYIEK